MAVPDLCQCDGVTAHHAKFMLGAHTVLAQRAFRMHTQPCTPPRCVAQAALQSPNLDTLELLVVIRCTTIVVSA